MKLAWLLAGLMVVMTPRPTRADTDGPPSKPPIKKGHAQVLCGVLDDAQSAVAYTIPARDKRKLEKPIACALHVDDPGDFRAFITVVGGTPHTGQLSKATDLEVMLQPGTDFRACRDFTIAAEIDDDYGTPLWKDKIETVQACAANAPFEFHLGCTQDQHDVAVELDTTTPLVATGDVSCTLSGTDPRATGGTASIKTSWRGGKSSVARAGAMAGNLMGDGSRYVFTLARGDWDVCAADLVVTASLFGANKKLLTEVTTPLAGRCEQAGTKPAPTKPAPADAGLQWADGALDQLPDPGSVAIAQTWANNFFDEDVAALSQGFPAGGVTVIKVAVTAASLQKQLDKAGGMFALFRVQPGFDCKHPEKPTADECKWSKWHVQLKSKTEFWLYNTDDSFYGPYPSLVFRKAGAKWAWVGVKLLDLGEP